MSLQALSWAFPIAIIGPRKAVLLALAEHANERGECWPSVARLVLYSGIRERAVRVALRDLESAALISTERLNGRGNRYCLALRTLAPDAGDEPEPRHEMPPTPAPHATPPRHDVPVTPASHAAPPRHVMPPTPAPHAGTPARHAPEPLRTLNEPSKRTLKEPPTCACPRKENPTPDAIATWNRICGVRLPAVAKATDQRKQAFATRFREDLNADPAQWEALCRRVIASDFLTGDNARGFQATFDWVIKPANMAKIQDGNYANRPVARPVSNANAAVAYLDHVARGNGRAPPARAPPDDPPGFLIDVPPGDYYEN